MFGRTERPRDELYPGVFCPLRAIEQHYHAGDVVLRVCFNCVVANGLCSNSGIFLLAQTFSSKSHYLWIRKVAFGYAVADQHEEVLFGAFEMSEFGIDRDWAIFRAWASAFFVLSITETSRHSQFSIDSGNTTRSLFYMPSAPVDALTFGGMAWFMVCGEALIGTAAIDYGAISTA
jgi:hypothetical protein